MNILLKKLDYYDELMEILFKNSIAIWATNILAPIGLMYILKNYIDIKYLLIFVIVHLILGAFRVIISKRGLLALNKNNKNLANKLLAMYLFIIFLSSTLYGLISVLTIFYAQQLQVFILLALIFGLISGSFSTLSSIFHAMILYMLPFSSIFIIGLFISGEDVYILVASIILIYLMVTIPSSYRIYLTLKTNIEKAQVIQKQKETLMINQVQLIQSAKMASTGEMMANIAHQWRQPLSSISLTSSSIKLRATLNQEIEKTELVENMDTILAKTQYLSKTIDTFRDFIKEDKDHKEIVLQDTIEQVLQIINSTLKNNYIELIYDYKNDKPIKISMINGELEQVIINIINNAKDVLIEREIKNPTIKLEIKKLKDFVQISIEDNAGGVPKEIIDKIYEPYFSTKHQSQGTGLGLHMSYKIIVESLKGQLYVKNTNSGAKFFIELPL